MWIREARGLLVQGQALHLLARLVCPNNRSTSSLTLKLTDMLPNFGPAVAGKLAVEIG